MRHGDTKVNGIFPRKGKRGTSYQVRYRRFDGTQASRTFPNRKDAERFKAQLVLDDDTRSVTKTQRKLTFEDAAVLWISTCNHAHSTRRRRDQILRLHLLPPLGKMPIRSIKASHLRSLIASWERDGLSPLCIRNHIAIARPIFKMALADGLIQKDPTMGLKLKSTPLRKSTALTPDMCHKLLDAVDGRYRCAFYILLATGLRIGELINLKVGDIDFTAKTLIVRQSKTQTGRRTIDLSDPDLRELKQQLLTLAQPISAETVLFQSPKGKALQYRNLTQRILRDAIASSGLPPFTLHDLRKTHATMLVAAGVDPKVVQERMGHTSIETTLKYYAQPTKERQIAAASVAGSYLFNDPSFIRAEVQADI